MAAARLHHHVAILLKDNVGTLVEVKDGYSTEFGGGAAGFGYVDGSHEVDECLDDGVIGGVHVRVEGEGALAMAVVSGVAVRRDDPILPPEIFEAHVQSSLLAAFTTVSATEKVPVNIVVGEILLQV